MTNYNNSNKLYFPKDLGMTKEIYFTDCTNYNQEDKISQKGRPYTHFTYQVQLLGSDQLYELSVLGNLHEKIQITRPGPQDKCTLFKLQTARGLADSIQFPAITHSHRVQHEQVRATPAPKFDVSMSHKEHVEAIIGVSWAIGILHSSLTPSMATLSNSTAAEQDKINARNLIGTRVQLLLQIRDQEAQAYIKSQLDKEAPLPFEEPKSGINLNDIPF